MKDASLINAMKANINYSICVASIHYGLPGTSLKPEDVFSGKKAWREAAKSYGVNENIIKNRVKSTRDKTQLAVVRQLLFWNIKKSICEFIKNCVALGFPARHYMIGNKANSIRNDDLNVQFEIGDTLKINFDIELRVEVEELGCRGHWTASGLRHICGIFFADTFPIFLLSN